MSDTEKTRKGFNYRKFILPAAFILGAVGAAYIGNMGSILLNKSANELAIDIENNLKDATLYDYGNTQQIYPTYSSSTASTRYASPETIPDRDLEIYSGLATIPGTNVESYYTMGDPIPLLEYNPEFRNIATQTDTVHQLMTPRSDVSQWVTPKMIDVQPDMFTERLSLKLGLGYQGTIEQILDFINNFRKSELQSLGKDLGLSFSRKSTKNSILNTFRDLMGL